MENSSPNLFISFLPLILMSLSIAVAAYLLAKEKGRKVWKWTILGAIPFVNFACLWFFIGAANLKFERKIDDLIARLDATCGRDIN
jgi:O-antigen/teichoic acid export membrane protein